MPLYYINLKADSIITYACVAGMFNLNEHRQARINLDGVFVNCSLVQAG